MATTSLRSLSSAASRNSRPYLERGVLLPLRPALRFKRVHFVPFTFASADSSSSSQDVSYKGDGASSVWHILQVITIIRLSRSARSIHKKKRRRRPEARELVGVARVRRRWVLPHRSFSHNHPRSHDLIALGPGDGLTEFTRLPSVLDLTEAQVRLLIAGRCLSSIVQQFAHRRQNFDLVGRLV